MERVRHEYHRHWQRKAAAQAVEVSKTREVGYGR
jgi:hypothetical protein